MRRFVFPLAALALAAAFTTALSAQKVTPGKTGGGGSPHELVEWTVDGGNISIEYGRPSLKGRTPGKDVDPMEGVEWRTGADGATTLKTDKMLMLGSIHVNPGTYTIYTMPVKGTWQLIINKKTGQWGIPYPGKAEDVGRAAMKMSTNAKPVEQLTISIEDTPAGATLHIDWGTTRASMPFTIG
jgi:Protein of unknown function (DUF2911)